jgi:hypothetical protein
MNATSNINKDRWENRLARIFVETGGTLDGINDFFETLEGRIVIRNELTPTPAVSSKCGTNYSGVSARILELAKG